MTGKKRTGKPRQQRIPGTIDLPTENVLRKAEDYVAVLSKRMTLQEDESALRKELIDLMKEAQIETFAIDGHTVTLVHAVSDKIQIKKETGADPLAPGQRVVASREKAGD